MTSQPRARAAAASSALFLGLVFLSRMVMANEAAPRAAVFTDKLVGTDDAFAHEIASQVSAAGYAVDFIGLNVLTNPARMAAGKFDLLVLAGARAIPAPAAPAIESYLQQGGDLLALGLPAWESPLFALDGRWMTRTAFEEIIATQRPEQLLFDFAVTELRSWSRATDDPKNVVRHEIVPVGGRKALHVAIERLSGWETFCSPVLTNGFPAGHTLTCFRARGTAHTKQLSLEWTERDGSRWIATVDLTPEWRDYSLTPQSFKAWEPPPARSGKNDVFHPEHAVRCAVGLAHSHTAVEGVEQEYWFADLGTAKNPFATARLPDEFQPPHLESVSPGYLFFPINGGQASRLSLSAFPHARDSEKRPAKSSFKFETGATPVLRGMQPRPRGVGFDQDRQYRWEPLLAAYDAGNDDLRGTIAALLVHVKPPYRGGVWAAFTPTEPEFYRLPIVKSCLREAVARMQRGLFLVEGGAEFFTTFPDQETKVGARVANFGLETLTNLSVAIEVDGGPPAGWRILAVTLPTLLPGQIEAVQASAKFRAGQEQVVETLLLAPTNVVDRLRHEVAVWKPKAKPEFTEIRDGGFWRRGRPWKAHGVNYMPSSGIGLADGRHFEYWLERGAYDPEVIERDLRRIQAMNLNAVSAFIYYESLGAQHLLDFLRRCEAHDLQVNLSLRPGTPLDFRWDEMRSLIEHYRLAQNDTVFAYDLAWEPSHGNHAQQEQAYQTAWANWVEKNISKSWDVEKAWGANGAGGFQFAIADLQRTSIPPMEWLTKDGPWRKCVADYRRFLDELLRDRYDQARRLVKAIDPHHAVSFRMQHAGDPTFNWDAFLPYDFYGLADAVDIWEPEAYGRIGDWEKVKPGRFTADYARLCDPGKPLVWAEMGFTVWDQRRMAPSPEKLLFAANYYRDFYRMLTESGADGVFFWWYPGGYRLNERSDFGIINPDGTDRPVTAVIRYEGGKFLTAPKPDAKADHWIPVDRDRDARGLFGIYEATQDEYWKAIAAGKNPALKWEPQPRGAAGTKPQPRP